MATVSTLSALIASVITSWTWSAWRTTASNQQGRPTGQVLFHIPPAFFRSFGEMVLDLDEAGQSAEPYVAGALLAAREAVKATGLIRGLDGILFGEGA